MRGSPTLVLLEELKRHGACITGYDPAVEVDRIAALGVTPAETLDSGLRSCRVCVFMTNHPQFSSLSTPELVKRVQDGVIVVDGWGLFDPEECRRSGLKHIAVGVGEHLR